MTNYASEETRKIQLLVAASNLKRGHARWWRGLTLQTRRILFEHAELDVKKIDYLWENLGKEAQIKLRNAAGEVMKEAAKIKAEVLPQ